MAHISDNPQQSLAAMSESSTLLSTIILRKLPKHHFHPYKLQFTQVLSLDNSDKTLKFCEKLREEIFKNSQLLNHICFSDESTFF